MSLIVRKAREEDAADLNRLLLALTAEQGDIAAMAVQIAMLSKREEYCLLVAELEGIAVGTVMGVLCSDISGRGRPFMVVENVIVDETCRGLGIAKRLFGDLERWAVGKDCAYALLVSGAERKQAHKFYQTVGYTEECGFRKKL